MLTYRSKHCLTFAERFGDRGRAAGLTVICQVHDKQNFNTCTGMYYSYLHNDMPCLNQTQISQINKSLSKINPNFSKKRCERKRRFTAAASAAFTFLGDGWLRASATRHARLITPESVDRETRRHICLGAGASTVNPRQSTSLTRSISRVNQARLKRDYSVHY